MLRIAPTEQYGIRFYAHEGYGKQRSTDHIAPLRSASVYLRALFSIDLALLTECDKSPVIRAR